MTIRFRFCVNKYKQSYQAIYLLLDLFVCYFIVSREKGEVAELLQVLSNKIDLENMAEEGNIIWSQLKGCDREPRLIGQEFL